MTRPITPRTARRLARAVAVCAGAIIAALLLHRHELAAITAGVALAIVLTVLLHHYRSPKGNR